MEYCTKNVSIKFVPPKVSQTLIHYANEVIIMPLTRKPSHGILTKKPSHGILTRKTNTY